MAYTVVTEGLSDVLLLQAILNVPTDNANVKFEAAGGWSSADSLARSLLISRNGSVALVVDADATDPNRIEERRQFLYRSLGGVADETRWRVFVIAPSIEALVFEDPSVLQSLTGSALTETDLYRAKFEPKDVLTNLLRNRSLAAVFATRLPEIDVESLRKNTAMSDLIRFVSGKSEIHSSPKRVKATR